MLFIKEWHKRQHKWQNKVIIRQQRHIIPIGMVMLKITMQLIVNLQIQKKIELSNIRILNCKQLYLDKKLETLLQIHNNNNKYLYHHHYLNHILI